MLSARVHAEDSDSELAKATQAVLAAIPTAESDPQRPVYHFHPPANWTNDPNGPLYYKAWHHLFYQLNPFEARLGNQHWGHARSRDLVNWEHLPIAIGPSSELGEKAIFSGGAAIAGDGRPRVIYTSIGHPQPEQWMVIPVDDDLFRWEKYRGNPVLAQAAHIAGPISQWRDPFLFQQSGATYMVCGGAGINGRAQVQLYRALKPDLTQWKHLGAVFQGLEREIRNFECPNLFPLDGKWVLIVSPNRACEYWIGDLDTDGVEFMPTAHGVLDAGEAYASNVYVDNKGRTILWLWGRTNTPEGKRWGSVMTLPRILSLSADGYLQQSPAPEFEVLRGPVTGFPATALEKPFVPEGVATDCAEIEAEFTGDGTFGIELRRARDGTPGIVAALETGFQGTYLKIGASRAFVGRASRYEIRVFLDKCSIEVYVNGGVAAIYNAVNATPDDLGIAVFGQPAKPIRFPGNWPTLVPPRLESLKIWPMKGASFSMEHFHV